MSNNKLTDTEVKKALEYRLKVGDGTRIDKEILDLINRLQEKYWKLYKENDDLKNGFFQKRYETVEHLELMGLRKGYDDASKERDYFQLKSMNLEEDIKTAKVEAYKECIEKVKKLMEGWGDLEYHSEVIKAETDLDSLLNEFERKENITYDD